MYQRPFYRNSKNTALLINEAFHKLMLLGDACGEQLGEIKPRPRNFLARWQLDQLLCKLKLIN
ncbi:hypothetical protein GXM_00651 [Nostoc sphaeroides CCNUC1]|uniref:Uncharacterized protein n=1 Tax=Nostoc sphaeroides CCNUC1 TaxID=2653204 RepID=A0A5P8VRT9_9NOSO|nr:hypothetical protein GXM_00651 [Nostoc sphaeroides CCNUC1]